MWLQKAHQAPSWEWSILSVKIKGGGGEMLNKTDCTLAYPSIFCQVAAQVFLSWKLGVNQDV